MSPKLAQRSVVVVLVLAAIAGAFAVHLHSSGRIDDQHDDRITFAREQLKDSLSAREYYLEDVADMIGVHDDADLLEFTRYAHERGRQESAVVSVQWLRDSPDGNLVAPRGIGSDPMLVQPENQRMRSLAQADDAPSARLAIRRAALQDRPASSPSLTLPNGDPAFYLAVPIEARRFSGDVSQVESQSTIVGLVDARSMLAAGLGPDPVPVSISDENGANASLGGDQESPVTTTVPARGQVWTLSVEGGSIPPLERAVPWLVLLSGFALALVVALLLGRAVSRRDAALAIARAREAELEQRSREDELTRIYNRRHFAEELSRRLTREPDKGNLAAFLIDLDHFKRVNDEHGHLNGDLVLQVAAQRLASVVRPSETLARWGGEEFAVLAGELDRAGALALAERLRLSISESPIEIGGEVLRLTASIGVAIARPGDDADTVVGAADRALYEAKDAGRDRVCIWEPGTREPASAS